MKTVLPDSVRVIRNFHIEEKLVPKLSMVIPCYGVAEHIHRLLESLERQDCDRSDVEFIFVIDGSPDETEAIVASWMSGSGFMVTLAVQENLGVAGALNTGNKLSRGNLINTSGADDSLSDDYLSQILSAADEFPEIHMFVSRMVRLEGPGRPIRHPLDFRFNGVSRNTVVDLSRQPEMIHLAGGLVTVKRDILLQASVEYDERLRNGFEDADFICRYLLSLSTPEYLLLPHALYYYWSRPESIMGQAALDYSGKLEALKFGHQKLLDVVGQECPQWLGNVLLYDLFWIFQAHARLTTTIFGLSEENKVEFDRLSRGILQAVGLETIRSFNVVTLSLDIRSAWEAAIGPRAVVQAAVRWDHDLTRNLYKITYFSGSPTPSAKFVGGQKLLHVPFSHVREITYFGTSWSFEHISWIDVNNCPCSPNEIRAVSTHAEAKFLEDGKVMGLRALMQILGASQPESPSLATLRSRDVEKAENRVLRRARRDDFFTRSKLSTAFRLRRLLGWSKRYRSSWILMDGIDQANDNAEHLYEYIVNHRPELNVWFVLEAKSEDWNRLESKGFKLIPYGSLRHFVAMKSAEVYASSHLDQDVVQPFKKDFLSKTWHFTFLQHGVTKDRQDRWFNTKNINHLVTSTVPETQSIVGDPSPYKFSSREVSLTGMPRHDRLYRLTNELRDARGCLLIMPTWRRQLSDAVEEGNFSTVRESEYAREWTEFLQGDYLTSVANQNDLDVVFLPHRGSASFWDTLKLPEEIQRISYVGDDIQQYLARAVLTVTDYSSQAFEGAYCGAPCVYFQFDVDTFNSGGHVYAPGYFDYERDGFGPVTYDVDSLEESVALMLAESHPGQLTFRRRVEELYPFRDDHGCERVVAEIEKRLEPYSNS